MPDIICNNGSLKDLEGELWEDIIGYESLYMISNMGRVKGCNRIITCKNGAKKPIKSRIIRQHFDGKLNYLCVVLNKNGKTKGNLTHRLVGIHFIKNDQSKNFINHKDGDKINNIISNLEWVTKSENELHRTRVLGKGIRETNSMSKLSNLDVTYIYTNPDNLNRRDMMNKFDVKDFCITSIWNHHRWTSLTKNLKRNKIIYGKMVDIIG